MRDAEKRLQRSRMTIAVIAKKLGVGTRFGGGGKGAAWFFTERDLKLIGERMAAASVASMHEDARRHADWYRARFKSTRMYGRLGASSGHLGATYGIEGGRKSGGRPRLATAEQETESLRLLREGRTVREVAAVVFGDPALYGRVHRLRALARK